MFVLDDIHVVKYISVPILQQGIIIEHDIENQRLSHCMVLVYTSIIHFHFFEE